MIKIKLKCKHCNGVEFSEEIDFGCFIKIHPGNDGEASIVEVLRERPGRLDIPLKEVICPLCGCCSGLEKLTK